MITSKMTLMCLVIFTVVVQASTAWATDYTFDVTSGDWNLSSNWDPPGIPGENDKAIIPNGKTCKITITSQEVKTIDVQTGGTLGIEGGTLTIGIGNDPLTSTINGSLYLKKPSSATPKLRVRNQMTFTGSGKITARQTDGHGLGEIQSMGPGSEFIVGGDLTVMGTIKILVSTTNNGTIKVDHADDELAFGNAVALSQYTIDGPSTGKLLVSAGLMRLNYVNLTGAVKWNITGGELWVTDLISISDPNDFTTKVDITGGTLDLDDDFQTNGGIKFGGGRIELAQGKSAAFLSP